MTNEDIESRLRGLAAKSPPPELRERVLRRARESLSSHRHQRRPLLLKVALACAILLLTLIDVSVERIQGARIAKLTGGPILVAGSAQPAQSVSLAALHARRLAWAGLLEGAGLP